MKRLTFKELLDYIAVFIIFTGAWSYYIHSVAEFRISYVIIIAVFLLWAPFLKSIYFNGTFLAIFAIILVTSLYNILLGNNTLPLLFKQIIGISLNVVFFYTLIKINGYDVKKLFKIYMNIAFVVALIGIFQEICFLLKFSPGYNYSWISPFWHLGSLTTDRFLRINSILPEPPHFCNVMMPAFFVSVTSFLKDSFKLQGKWKSLIIIISFFLAFSSASYVGVFFCLMLLLYNCRKSGYAIICIVVMCLLAFFLYNNDEIFKIKLDDSVNMLLGKTILQKTNTSTYAIFTNLDVTYNSLKNSPIFGSGLGSHWESYDKYLLSRPDSVVGQALYTYHSIQCRGDASSLFLRLLSELGLFGLLLFFVFIFKFYITKRQDKKGYLWIISNAILAMFFMKLIRMGHYFVDGFFFFLWIYYFSKLELRYIEMTDKANGKKI